MPKDKKNLNTCTFLTITFRCPFSFDFDPLLSPSLGLSLVNQVSLSSASLPFDQVTLPLLSLQSCIAPPSLACIQPRPSHSFFTFFADDMTISFSVLFCLLQSSLLQDFLYFIAISSSIQTQFPTTLIKTRFVWL